MKRSIAFSFTVSTLLLASDLFAAGQLHAQTAVKPLPDQFQPPPPVGPASGTNGSVSESRTDAVSSDPAAETSGEDAYQKLNRAAEELKRATAGMGQKMSAMRLGITGPAVNRLLVIPGAGAKATPIEQTRSDLAIMSRLLSKAAASDGASRNVFRFNFGGIQIGDRRELDALYLSGYGAVFLLDVDFPLVPPPKQPSTHARESKEADSAWENARRELAGMPSGEEGGFGRGNQGSIGFGGGGFGNGSFGGGRGVGGGYFLGSAEVEYRGELVKQLTDSLINALRHASNIKSVGKDEKIIVHVLGRGYRGRAVNSTLKSRQVRSLHMESVNGNDPTQQPQANLELIEQPVETEAALGTSLTLEVSQQAVMDVAEARITRDEFGKQVKVTTRDEAKEDK